MVQTEGGEAGEGGAHMQWGDQVWCTSKVDMSLTGKENSNSHGARPVHQVISVIKWIQTRRISIENSLSLKGVGCRNSWNPVTGGSACGRDDARDLMLHERESLSLEKPLTHSRARALCLFELEV